jgi:hypothetical protein
MDRPEGVLQLRPSYSLVPRVPAGGDDSEELHSLIVRLSLAALSRSRGRSFRLFGNEADYMTWMARRPLGLIVGIFIA